MRKSNLLKSTTALFFSFLTIALLSSFTSDQPGWEKLGSRNVTYKADFDEILVTAREGRFDKLKLKVEKADVHFDRVVVHYRKGKPEKLIMRNNIPAGGETRVMDLKGNNRIIRKVVFFYKTHPKEDKRARVILFGRH